MVVNKFHDMDFTYLIWIVGFINHIYVQAVLPANGVEVQSDQQFISTAESKSTKPAEVIKSTKPAGAIKSTKPAEGTKSTKSVEEIKLTKPSEGIKSTKSAEEIKPTKSAEQIKPIDKVT